MSITKERANIDLCLRANQELFGDARFDVADELLAADFVDHESHHPEVTGPASAKATVGWIHAGLDDVDYEVEDVVAADDRVVLRVTMRATHAREFLGRAATGRRFAMQQIHVFRIADGRIAEHWACRDDLGMMRQLS